MTLAYIRLNFVLGQKEAAKLKQMPLLSNTNTWGEQEISTALFLIPAQYLVESGAVWTINPYLLLCFLHD